RFLMRAPRHLLRRARAALPAKPAKAESDEVASLFDMSASGWFNNQTGELFKGFPINSQDIVIDVGCGLGGYSRFAAVCGAEVIATDINPARIETVKAMLARVAKRPVHTYVTDSNPLPVADATATKVLAMEMLEHVDDPKQVIAELVRVGKPGAQYL